MGAEIARMFRRCLHDAVEQPVRGHRIRSIVLVYLRHIFCDKCSNKHNINHIFQTCSNTKFEGGLDKLHDCSPAASKWCDELTIRL